MKQNKLFVVLAVLAVLFAACNNAQQKQEMSDASEKQEAKAMTVNELMADIDAYVAKDVRLEGIVEHVCKHGGKRLHLMNASGEQKIRVESGKAITQFERELEGDDISISGVVKKQVIDEAYLNKRAEELQDEGNKHDHEEDGHGEGKHAGDNEGAQMVHRVNSMEQVENLRKQLSEKESKEIVSYWIEGKSFKKKPADNAS